MTRRSLLFSSPGVLVTEMNFLFLVVRSQVSSHTYNQMFPSLLFRAPRHSKQF